MTCLFFFLVLLFTSFTQYSQAEYFIDFDRIINFTHNNGNSKDFYYPEIVGSGVALLDYDNDGDLDVYLIQSGRFNNNKSTDKLYKNLLVESNELKFKEVTKELGLNNNHNYGIGIATADINNDGWVDFYLTNLKQNQVFMNQQGKSFKLLSSEVDINSWSSSASFCDINNDGFKDLYVSNYVNWSQDNNPKCFNKSSKRDYCGPGSFEGLQDSFYINDQGKQLVESTARYFPGMPQAPGLNVVCLDVNNDGWKDFIVANDGKPNLLWLNQKGLSFVESGLFSGLAVNAQGVAEASMGMAVSDFDLDGDMDVFFTHLMNETNTLYQNNGKGIFRDISNRSKLSRDSFAYTGWATGFLHVNDDIYPDLIIFNGAVADSSTKDTDISSLKQSNQLFINNKGKSFSVVKNESWLRQKAISRGAAFGDIDNDGDTDVIVNNNNGMTRLLLNNQNPQQWLGINININKNITVTMSNSTHKMHVNQQTDGSYASAHDKRLLFNQAQIEYFDKITVTANKKKLLEIPLTNSNKYIEIK